MAKNLIPEIAKMLGVELGEEFKFGNNNVKFWFDLYCYGLRNRPA